MAADQESPALTIHRRHFLKLMAVAGSSVLAGCGVTGLGGPSVKKLLASGQIKVPSRWKTDGLIPLPEKKILIGTNVQPTNVDVTPWRPEGQATMMHLNAFGKQFGIQPALSPYGIGTFAFYNDWFLDEKHDTLNKHGIIPVVRWVHRPFKSYKEIYSGQHDDMLKALAGAIAENGVPYVMIPYQSVNDATARYYGHANRSGKEYVAAYVHMHDIFGEEGANVNTIWSTKLKLGSFETWSYREPFDYIPPPEYVDWIGWSVNNHSKISIRAPSKSFRALVGNHHDRAAYRYPDTPQFFWEISTARGKSQPKWLDDALTALEDDYPWVKGAVFDVMPFLGGGRYGYFDPTFTDEAVEVVRRHLASGRYAGAYTDGSITLKTHKT